MTERACQCARAISHLYKWDIAVRTCRGKGAEVTREFAAGGQRSAAVLRHELLERGRPRADGLVDLGAVLVDGALHWFLDHLIARRSWLRGQVLIVANAAFVDNWNIAPRAHPGDGRFDTLETSTMSLRDRWQARSRLKLGTHVPHPAITTRRVEAVQYDFEQPTPIRLDGRSIGEAQHLSVRLEPDAVDIWI